MLAVAKTTSGKSSKKYELARQLQLEKELWHRECRRNLRSWSIQALSPEGFLPARHHDLLCSKLELVCSGAIDRLMVLMPPGHAKSMYVSRIFVPYWFANHQRTSVIASSNTSDLAETFGRRVRNLVHRERDCLGFTLQADSKSAGRWETSRGGEYFAAGINGGNGTTITGRRVDLGIIDDPVRNRQEARNATVQNKIMDYYRTEFTTRLKPEARIILVMTRWDVLDLGGQLEDEMSSGGDQWEILRLPALAEDPAQSTEENPIGEDPLGRKPGEALWPEEYDADTLERRRITIGELDFSALYQQRPKPPKGLLFDVDKIAVLSKVPEMRQVIRSWDLAATKQVGSNDPDWTVGLKLGRTVDDKYVVMDVQRFRGMPQEVESLIGEIARLDGKGCQIRLPEDPGQAGKAQAAYLVSKLAGYQVVTDKETGSKETRATPVVSQCNVGNLSMIEAKWNRAAISEMRDFPNGRKDDQVDALSGAFNVIGIADPPMKIAPDALKRMGISIPSLVGPIAPLPFMAGRR